MSLRFTSERGGLRAEVSLRREAQGDFLEVTIEDASGEGGLAAMLELARLESSREQLGPRGYDRGFRVEDLVALEVEGLPSADLERALRWLERRVGLKPRAAPASSAAGVPRLRFSFARRGYLKTSQRARYEREGGLLRLEAFELHPVEHCNLRCEHCCNMSPFVPPRTLSAEQVGELCRKLAAHLHADVFKIMGGEPLLHPDVGGVIRAARESGIADRVRLFTNGLLLHTMGEDFWRALDELTISAYASAPIKPAVLELARRKAEELDFVLNVKQVSTFSEVLRAEREHDDAAVAETYRSCWLRHRCIVVRAGHYFMCTRSAYAQDFHARILNGAQPEDAASAAQDGVPIDAPDLGARLLAYMNRATPLSSCRYCHGSGGPVGPHRQLRKSDVAARRLRVLGPH